MTPYYAVPSTTAGSDLLDLMAGLPEPPWMASPDYLPGQKLVMAYLAADIIARAWRASHPARNFTPDQCADDYRKIAVSAARMAAILTQKRTTQ